MSTEAHHECIYPHRKCQYLVSLHSFSEMKILLIKVTNILIYTNIKWVFADAIKVRVKTTLA